MEVKPWKFSGGKLSLCCLVLTSWDFVKLTALSFNHMHLFMDFVKGNWFTQDRLTKRIFVSLNSTLQSSKDFVF